MVQLLSISETGRLPRHVLNCGFTGKSRQVQLASALLLPAGLAFAGGAD